MKTRDQQVLTAPPTALPETGDFGKRFGQGRAGTVRSIHSIHGALGGRPRVKVDVDLACDLFDQGKSIKAIARELGVGEGTLRRALGLVSVGGRSPGSSVQRLKPRGGAL
jgi:hypothetical protein